MTYLICILKRTLCSLESQIKSKDKMNNNFGEQDNGNYWELSFMIALVSDHQSGRIAVL